MIRNLIVNINSDRSVFPKELKVANRYEIKTNVLNIKFSFDLPENSFVYLVLTRNQIQYYYPLINNSFSFGSNETWINGGWIGYVLISKAEIIDGVVNSSEALFISDAFGLTVGDSEFNIEKLEQQELPAQLHLLYDDLLHLKAELEELIRNGDFSDLSITVDSALSKTSENPVQNKVITAEIDLLKKSIDDLPDSYSKTESDEKYQPKGNYLTEHQDLSEYAKTSYVDSEIDEVKKQIENLPSGEGGTVELKKLKFTGSVNAEYDGTEEVTVDIPSGGSGGKIAKSKKIAEITIEELVASVTITLDENYHRLVVYWVTGANGEAKIVNESGTAVSQNLYVFINTTIAGYTERRIGGIKGSDKTWKNDILVIDFTHDCKRLVGSYTSEVRIDGTSNAIATLTTQNSFLYGNEVVAPLKGNTLNFVPQSGGYMNKTTRLFVWGEYYEGVQA